MSLGVFVICCYYIHKTIREKAWFALIAGMSTPFFIMYIMHLKHLTSGDVFMLVVRFLNIG